MMRGKVHLSDSGIIEVATQEGTTCAPWVNLVMHAGQDTTFRVALSDASAQPMPLAAGYTASFTVRHAPGTLAVLTLTQASGIALSDATENIKATFTAAQANTLTAARYYYLLTITETATGKTTWVMSGSLSLYV